MQFLTNTKIDFMKYRKVFIWVSLAFLAVSVVEIFALTGINLGIDFAGGTQLTVSFQERPEIDRLRDVLREAGLAEALIQRYGDIGSSEVLIKTPVVGGSEEGSGQIVIDALQAALNGSPPEDHLDLNQKGTDSLATHLFTLDPDRRVAADEDAARAHYARVAAAVMERRKGLTLFTSWEQLEGIAVLSTEALEALRQRAYLGAFHVLQNENVGPQIGSELRRKGILAVSLSLVGMLLYIWYRFELRYGIGALVAVFHDFLITLGLFAIVNYEFNLPTIAAFLTLVGYSVNDTVVIFDRVRENRRRHRRMPLVNIMNMSLNQTLSRTVLTSGTTLLVVGSLFFLGGEVIRGFAFVLLVGVIVGTYSSIFVASPFALLWEQLFGREAREERRLKKAAAAPPVR